MNCQEVQAKFDERLDELLDAAQRGGFDAHIAACPACAAQWRAYAGVWMTVGRHVAPMPSVGFAERTLRRLDEMPVRRLMPWFLPVWRWGVASGLAVIMLAAIGWFGWQRARFVQTVRMPKLEPLVEAYTMAQQDRLEDFDVVASLHLLNGEVRNESQTID